MKNELTNRICRLMARCVRYNPATTLYTPGEPKINSDLGQEALDASTIEEHDAVEAN